MSEATKDRWLAGVDGCRAGWIAVFVRPAGDDHAVRVFNHFADVLASPFRPAVIAVDMPVGLPDRCGAGGRAAENAIRPLLGKRQSSVFAVPSRAAMAASGYREACEIALATSDPPRKISKQLYNIAPKIREVDECLRIDATLAARVREVHPELAFWRLNGGQPLDQPKRIKSRPHPPGMALRRKLLSDAGLPQAAALKPPTGAAEDDLLDALACAAIARRVHAGTAQPFPDPPPRDTYDLPMAIWA